MVEGELGELVAGEYPVLGQQPAQLPIAFSQPASQVSRLAGEPIGSSPSSPTGGGRHHITASESPTSSVAQEPPCAART
jgi:hypothetical protein